MHQTQEMPFPNGGIQGGSRLNGTVIIYVDIVKVFKEYFEN